MIKSFHLIFFVLFTWLGAQAQPGGNPRYEFDRSLFERSGNSQEEASIKKAKKNKTNKISLNDQFDQKIEEYYLRMEENARLYRKMQKDMEKPQFTDPTYFGHKRPPKKRPPGKRKFCKECGMVH